LCRIVLNVLICYSCSFSIVFLLFAELPADKATYNPSESCDHISENSAVMDCSASSSVNEVMHRPSRLDDRCSTDEHTTCSHSECTCPSSYNRHGTDGICTALQSDTLPSQHCEVFCMLELNL